jgi:ABC-type nitrate/sulfonate/bicarbonate transport system substrate-binding protein
MAGCLGDGTDEGQGETTPTPTETPRPEVAWRGQWVRSSITYANFSAAEEYTWAEQGLDVTYKSSQGSKAAAKSVASGAEQFGNGGFGAVLQLIENGAPLTVLGVQKGALGAVISLSETGITEWTDLEGQVVGRYPFGSTGPVAEAAMRERGVDLSAVTFRNVQPGSGLQQLISGEIDALVRYGPQGRAELEFEGFDVNVLLSSDVLGHLGAAIFAHDSAVENDPDLTSRVVGGWLDGIRLWAEDYEKAIEAHRPHVEENGEWRPDYYERVLGDIYASQAPPEERGREHGKGWIPAGKMETTIEVFTDAGLLEEQMPAEDVYTNEFIDRNHDLAVDTAEALYDRLAAFEVGPDAI